MATYTELFNIAYSSTYPYTTAFTTLMKKVTVAVSKAAYAVLSEDPGTTNHTNRLAWAQNAMKNPPAFSQQMLWAVLQQSGIANAGDAALDTDVQTAVNNLVNTFALGS